LEFLPAFIRPVAAFVLYFASGVTLTGLFLAIYLRLTPYAEMALIRAGNRAAATSLSGALLGYVIALASAIAHSVSLRDMLSWGVAALLVQAVTYLLARMVFRDLAAAIERGEVSAGILVAAMSVAAGILNAASMSY
jgi:putative membrane protein